MTREEIIAKWDGKTPRERDAWVAEVVFDTNVYRNIFGSPFDDITGVSLPRYTEDISAAWRTLEKLRFQGVLITIETYVGQYASVTDEDERTRLYKRSAPEAICLAAIIAKLTKEVAA